MLDFSLSKATPFSQMASNFGTGINQGAQLRQAFDARGERKKQANAQMMLEFHRKKNTVMGPGGAPTLDKEGYLRSLMEADPNLARQEAQELQKAEFDQQKQQVDLSNTMAQASERTSSAAKNYGGMRMDQQRFGLDKKKYGLDEQRVGIDQQRYGLDERKFGLNENEFAETQRRNLADESIRRDAAGATATAKTEELQAKQAESARAAESVVTLTDEIVSDPAFAVGGSAKRLLGMMPGSQTGAFNSKVDQLVAALQLEIAGKLRGQGAITESERKMLRQAATRLSRGLPQDEFIQEINKIRQSLGADPISRPEKGGRSAKVATPDESGYVTGTIYKDANGNSAVYLGNGKWKESKQ
jgi:hypothetical protein